MQPMTLREVFEDWLQSLDIESTEMTRRYKKAVLAQLAKAEAAVAYCESGDALDAALSDDDSVTHIAFDQRKWQDGVDRAQLANDLAWHEWNNARDAAAVFESNQ